MIYVYCYPSIYGKYRYEIRELGIGNWELGIGNWKRLCFLVAPELLNCCTDLESIAIKRSLVTRYSAKRCNEVHFSQSPPY
ncbi:MAG: hypothetical protein F6K47_03230 [Symploca sp. SIO2E6]|nr:hypothetical protein [Symploca sp. SIO2E6]